MQDVLEVKSELSQCGVYVIEHVASGKKYVGSAAKSFRQRFVNHLCSLRKRQHHSKRLQSAWNKYGEDAFVFRVAEVTRPEHAVAIEQTFIDWHNSADPKHGYNIEQQAGSRRGRAHSQQTRSKMSKAQSGRVVCNETRAKLSTAAKSRKGISEETRAKMSAASKGRVASAATRAKLSLAQSARIYSLEDRAKMSSSQTGRVFTKEARANMSAAAKRRKRTPRSPETRAKISAAHKGKVMSDESRMKMSESAKNRKQTHIDSVIS